MKVLTVIADIVGSRTITDRRTFQQKLESKLNSINSASRSILSPYTITLGDEFQAVYTNPGTLFADIYQILKEFYPIKFRFSVGSGIIATKINKKKSIGMDGPAFYNARNGLSQMKSETITSIQFFPENMPDAALINQSLLILNCSMSKWKLHTFIIFSELLQYRSINEIANIASVSTRAVYKIQKTNYLKEYLGLLELIQVAIESELKEEK